MAILYVEGQQVSGAVDNAASISCLDKNGNKSNVQAELDKKGNGSGAGFEPVKMTQAEYDALPEEQQKSGAYLITDAKKLDALEVGFDDTETGLGVDNVQDAINVLANTEWEYVHVTTSNTQVDLDLSSIKYIGIGGIVNSSGTQEIDNVTILPVSVWLDLNLKLQCFSHNGSQLFLAYVTKVSDTSINVAFNAFTSAVLIYK